jgi:hypothetical protein
MDKPRYVSYLLRLWQTESEGQLVWRASLESPRTGARIGFLSLEGLYSFLEQETAAVQGSSNDADAAGSGSG